MCQVRTGRGYLGARCALARTARRARRPRPRRRLLGAGARAACATASRTTPGCARAGHARRAARPARAARRRHRPLQPALGPRSRPRSRHSRDWSRATPSSTGCAPAASPPSSALVGAPRWANGGRDAELRPARGRLRGTSPRAAATRYPWVREWLIWNEPNQARWLRPTAPALYVRAAPQPGVRRDPRREPERAVGRRRDRAARGQRRRLAGRLDPRHARAGRASTPTRTTRIPPDRARRRSRGGCGHCETITMATLERLLSEVARAFGAEADLADGVRATRRTRPTALGSQSAQAELSGEAALRAYKRSARRHAHPLPRPGRAGARALAERPLHGLGARRSRARAFPLPLAQAARSGGARALGQGAPAHRRPDLPRPGARRRRLGLFAARHAQDQARAAFSSVSTRRSPNGARSVRILSTGRRTPTARRRRVT